MRSIKVSDDVYRELQRVAIPFEERTPDDVLRRVLRTNNEAPGTPSMHLNNTPSFTARRNPQSFKQEGKENRHYYIEMLQQKGIKLKLERRTAYLTPKGNRVVLPVANHPWKPGRWFLGAPKEFFENANTALILICKDGAKCHDFIIPAADVQKILPKLTVVKGELRFNVMRDRDAYCLYRPGIEKMDISHFLNNYRALELI